MTDEDGYNAGSIPSPGDDMRIAQLLPVLLPLALTACFDSKSDDDDDDDDDTTADGGGWDLGMDSGSTDGGGTDGGGTDGGDTDTDTDTDTDGGDTDTDTDTDGGGWDTDTDTDTDGGGGGDYFEPSSMLFYTYNGIRGGSLRDVTLDGTVFEQYFVVYLVNSRWSGPDDTDDHCGIFFDMAGASRLSGCDGCWGGSGWEVDTRDIVGTSGECDALDPGAWGDVEDAFSDVAFGVGYGPMSASFESDVQDAYTDYWSDYGDNFASAFIYTDVTGTAEWYEMNTAFIYEADDSGELVDGGAALVDVTGISRAPDGYYTGSPFYGFTL